MKIGKVVHLSQQLRRVWMIGKVMISDVMRNSENDVVKELFWIVGEDELIKVVKKVRKVEVRVWKRVNLILV